MQEVLDLTRREFEEAHFFFDELKGIYTSISDRELFPKFEQFRTAVANIRSLQNDLKSGYIAIGKYLSELQRDEVYKYVRQVGHGLSGYSNFYAFCNDVFGFKKTTVKNILSVYHNFCNLDGSIKLYYQPFSYSQLVELSHMDDKYLTRIPVQCSVRNIKKLKELYETLSYRPKKDDTYEDDLETYKKLKEEEKARKNANKNSINFVPAVSHIFSPEDEGQTSDPQSSGFVEGEDDRDLSTPEVANIVSFEDIRSGLLRQLDLLSKIPGWGKFSEMVSESLRCNTPSKICRHKELVNQQIENAHLKERIEELEKAGSSDVQVVPFAVPSGPVDLKNKKEREDWLLKYEDWGVWIDLPEVGIKYYRYNFKNGCSLIVETGYEYYVYSSGPTKFNRNFAIIDGERNVYDCNGCGGGSGAVKWLTAHAKEIS